MIEKVINRKNKLMNFEPQRIVAAIKAASESCGADVGSNTIDEIISDITSKYDGNIVSVENIQDSIVDALINRRLNAVTKKYMEYKTQRSIGRNIDKLYKESFVVSINEQDIKKDAAWIVSLVMFIMKHDNIDAKVEKERVLKISSSTIESLMMFSKETQSISSEIICNRIISAVSLYGSETDVVFANKAGNFAIKDIDTVFHKMAIEIIQKKHRCLDVLTFSKFGGQKITIKKSIFLSRIDEIIKTSHEDISYLKDRIIGLYKENMNLDQFYQSATSLLISCADRSPEMTTEIARLLLDVPRLYAGKNYGETGQLSACDFENFIKKGVAAGRVHEKMLDFDIKDLGEYIEHKRDGILNYIGAKVLVDRYLIRDREEIIETVQMMFMRVAMGISIKEKDQQAMAKKSYDILSQGRYMSGTPTLFNSGTRCSQMSSCYLSTTSDSLDGIMRSLSDNAMLSKWAGGLGIDWTEVRAADSIVKGTGGKSKGVIPFLKIMNSICSAVNQGGKRRGSGAAYLEVWHKDIYAFMDLRKNTGDERLRTPDINLASWIPDLFMKRVIEKGKWTLLCPSDAPGLHNAYGKEFEEMYEKYETDVVEGKISGRVVEAESLYKTLLSSLYETGYPWIVFKDPANICYMAKNKGVVKSSNLCTEIFEHSVANEGSSQEDSEIAVCTLGSVNIYNHINEKGTDIDWDKLKETVAQGVRMLDCCIDNNYYPVEGASISTNKYRFIGLGQAGLHDCLIRMKIPFESEEMIEFTGKLTEFISYHAISTSVKLAEEKGSYPEFAGSEWSKGKVPIDMFNELAKQRGKYFKGDTSHRLDWNFLRNKVKKGMRNSLTCAIAPTATISLIMGVSDSIMPLFGTMFSKSNMSGSFVYISDASFKLLKSRNLWSSKLVEDLKYYEGSVQKLDYIPDDIKKILKSAFEIDPIYLIRGASERQKYIDQGQSLNLFFSHRDGLKIMKTYIDAFLYGLKSTYYLRSRSATTIEKATVDVNAKGIRPSWSRLTTSASKIKIQRNTQQTSRACDLREGCESCQ